MKIGFIGYGSMAEALAGKWAGRHELFVGGRDAEKARSLAMRLGHGAGHGNEAEAAAFGEVVVLATRHEVVLEAVQAAGGPAAFAGKTVLDINNPVEPKADSIPKRYEGELSLAEALARHLPGAQVVKAFNMCQAKVWAMPDPTFDGRKLVAMLAGDDDAAKSQVAELVRDVGAEPADIGQLVHARLLEAAAALVIKLLSAGRDPFTVLNLIQPEVKPIA